MGDPESDSEFRALLADYGKLLRSAIASACPRDLGLNFEDLVQDATIRLWRAVESGREIRNAASYLHRVATTVTIDAARRAKARREEQMQAYLQPDARSEETREDLFAADVRQSPEELARQRELMALIKRALTELSENRKRAVELHLQGLNSQEIADLMAWGEAKARNLVYRGLEDLRRELRKQGVQYEG